MSGGKDRTPLLTLGSLSQSLSLALVKKQKNKKQRSVTFDSQTQGARQSYVRAILVVALCQIRGKFRKFQDDVKGFLSIKNGSFLPKGTWNRT